MIWSAAFSISLKRPTKDAHDTLRATEGLKITGGSPWESHEPSGFSASMQLKFLYIIDLRNVTKTD
jgi:hypothetical protein